jgi:thioredoxin-related protein
MLFGERVAVYCENHTEHTDKVRTSQETHYISAAKPNRLMLFGETVAVYCENHTEHTDKVRTSQETHYISATKPNWLMLFGETVAVYCENHTEHTDKLCEQNAGFWRVKAGGTYSDHWGLKSSSTS